jgi:hypothetical protein
MEKGILMEYYVFNQYMDVIAMFTEESDAKRFLEWKREEVLQDRNSEILDKIAEENNLDRKSPGLFPASITAKYYAEAREQINQEYVISEGSKTLGAHKEPECKTECDSMGTPRI